ncbi:MAG: response regulator [Verrucomicrobiaceae bacterium]|nr:MAG: response regulator [Verrucomicrobiaceae bacterium]
MEAHSEGPGSGSTFTVRLPAITPPVAAVPGAALSAVAGEGAGARILIVDDNIDTATGLARLLARRGYVAEIAHDGPEALHRASALLPAAVLLDIGLPMMDGYEVARRLRAEPLTADVLIIALSGYGQDEDRARSRAAGFDHHLVKPVDLEALRAVLTNGLKYR